MTEAEWFAWTDPQDMLIRWQTWCWAHGLSRRKLRLFVTACARRVVQFAPDPRLEAAIEAAEAFADARTNPERDRFKSARAVVWADATWQATAPGALATWLLKGSGTDWSIAAPRCASLSAVGASRQHDERTAQGALLRDIFRNPFRPVRVRPTWRTETAVLIARRMYESRDFAAMPILADAMQDAGCDFDDLVAHCRQPGEHVRGCWAVDLVLDKS